MLMIEVLVATDAHFGIMSPTACQWSRAAPKSSHGLTLQVPAGLRGDELVDAALDNDHRS
jgi:hypothetical protein